MNVFDLMAVLTLDSSGYKSGLNDAESAGSSAASKIGSALGGIAKVTGAAITAGATGVAALTKSAVENYAEYEQLVGGIETLYGNDDTFEEYTAEITASTESIKEFQQAHGLAVDGIAGPETQAALQSAYQNLGNASDQMIEQASNAYKTAGMSANDYMETATSFAAALVSSLGGDTQAAADMADMAITDMSDNANKMGTDMASIQNAYQGFAKQNYTMLDNLKLGYGGTKEEMQRLIDDANALKEEQGELGDLSIDSYADIVEAIHLVQDEMGITGTTALEASTTISGSVSSMKAAWSNLVTGLADDNADISSLVDNLLDTLLGTPDEAGERIGGVINNVMPRIETALEGVGTLIEGLAPIIAEYLPGLVENILPSLLSAATDLITSLAEALPSLLSAIGDVLPDAMATILTETLPTLVSAVPEIFQSFVDAIGNVISGVNPADVQAFVQNLTDNLITELGNLVGSISETIPQLAQIASGVVTGIALGLKDAAQAGVISDAIQNLISTGVSLATTALDTLEALLNIAPDIINGIVDGLNSGDLDLTSLAQGIVDVIEAGVNAIANIDWNAMFELAGKIIDAIIDAIGNVDVSDLSDAIGTFIENGGGKVIDLIAGYAIFKSIGRKIIATVANGVEGGASNTLAVNIALKLRNAISSAWSSGTIQTAISTLGTNLGTALEGIAGSSLATLGVTAAVFVGLAAVISAQGDEIHTTVDGMETDLERVQAINEAMEAGEATQKEVIEAQTSFVTNTANDVYAILSSYEDLANVGDDTWTSIISQITLAGETGSQQFSYLQSCLSDLGLEFDLTSGEITDNSGNVVASLSELGLTYDAESQSIIDANGDVIASLTEEGEVAVATAEQVATAVDAQTQAESKAQLAASQHSTAIEQLAQQYRISYADAEALYAVMETPPDTSGTVTAMEAVGDAAETNTTDATSAFENMTAEELAEMDTLIAELPSKSNNALTSMYNQFTYWKPTLKTSMGDITDEILDKVKLLASRMTTWGTTVINNLNTAMRGQQFAAYSAAYAVMLKARDGAEAVSLYSTGVNAGQGLINGLSAMYYSVYSAAYSLGLAAKRAANAALDINSPSKVFEQIGTYTGEGLALGIENEYDRVGEAASGLAEAAAVGVDGTGDYLLQDSTAPQWAQELSRQIANIRIYLDGDTLVGGTISKIDQQLQTINNNASMGNFVYA